MKLLLRAKCLSDVSSETMNVRFTDPRVRDWMTSQVWSVEDARTNQEVGEAVVVVAGPLPEVTTYVILKMGDLFRIIGAQGLSSALRGLGYSDFEVS
jgi:hypothetical protein